MEQRRLVRTTRPQRVVYTRTAEGEKSMSTENEVQKEIQRMDKEQKYSAGEKIAIAIVSAIALYGIIGTLLT